MRPQLQPIVFCGHGSQLYPLCDAAGTLDGMPGPSSLPASSTEAGDGGSSSTNGSKALLPVGNRPLLAFALQHVLSAGFSQAIVLAPAWQHAAIQKALSKVELVVPPGGKGIALKQRRVSIAFESSRSVASDQTHLTMHVKLLPLGPHDGDEKANDEIASQFRQHRLGTAELLRWVAASGHLRDADPLVLPVDLIGPTFVLRDLIDVYVQAHATHTDSPTACCALYERGAGEGLSKEREKEGPSRLVSAMSNDGKDMPVRLAFFRDSDMASDLEIRRSLLQSSPRTRISTRLLDAHVYIFNRGQILPLLEGNHRLTSLRDHVLPLVAKASWQHGLREKAGWNFDHGAANATASDGNDSDKMSSGEVETQELQSIARDSSLQVEALSRNARAQSALDNGRRRGENAIRCLAHVVRLQDEEGIAAETGFFVRANTIATYIEANRWLLKTLQKEAGKDERDDDYDVPQSAASIEPASSTAAGVSPSAQIAPDSVIGEGAVIGERASIRRTVVGEHCEIARGAKLNGCILLPGAKVGENTRLEGSIVCGGATIGARCVLVDCDVGPGVVVAAETSTKHEKLVGEHADDEDDASSDDEDEEEE